jgi:uncharacterized protein YjbI with pentapeptide repeats
MANPEHLEILKQGVEQWNKWRKENPLELSPDLCGADLHEMELRGANLYQARLAEANLNKASLSGVDLSYATLGRADLSGASLEGAKLAWADLHGANLSECYLVYANLSGANLSGAELSQAKLREADLKWTKLGGAKLRYAQLHGANLYRADLNGADLSEAGTTETNFADVDLSETKGLETIDHVGPSTISIDTIYKSHGKIPEVFLRGCGVPDEFIAYIGSMVGRPIEFYSCFISYSTKDQEFAERLHADLQAKGVRSWFAPHDIRGGRKIHEQIDDAIRLHDKLLLILSEHSMSSNWVKTEIANARQREEREKKNLLFPITLAPMEDVKKWKLFDADRGIDSAREIREYFIPDFSNWKDHDSYQKAFQRLVKDLKAEASK